MGVRELYQLREKMDTLEIDIGNIIGAINITLDVMGTPEAVRKDMEIQGKVILGHIRKEGTKLDKIITKELIATISENGTDVEKI